MRALLCILIQKPPMNTHTITLPIIDMNSPHCATSVEKAITAVPTLAASRVDLASHTAVLSGDPTPQAVRNAVLAVREDGYEVATDRHQFQTTGITCGGCVGSVTKILAALPGVLAVSVDVPLKRATVETVHGTVSDDAIRDALKPAGYGFIAQAA